ncbi:hypothetical protein PR202_ga17856 [Eleusine coracana subsp. coracana]|uniref:DUF985 domain-containing protein n=1 Tax=Eleusine coracana subsp. coracana TaxID=191504 RepID=A0AAV5CRN4_ELECO|nr:hypothetical protein PR202_ga17856 [Eleusine coracana subsp. coracana]
MAHSSTEEKKTAAEIVAALDLQRHHYGGFYLETFRDPSISLPKSALPPCYKVDRAVFEVHDDGKIKMTVVGPDLRDGQRPQYTVAPYVWFGAFLTRDIESFTEDENVLVKTPGRDPALHYSFFGVTCAPAFQSEDNELATREDESLGS